MIIDQISKSNEAERKMYFFLVLCTVALNAVRCSDNHVIEIISPRKDHSYALNITEFEKKLNDKKLIELQDRDIVVVSMTGIARIGKSFLFNFYLNYLNSEVTKIFFLFPKTVSKIILFLREVQ